MVKMKSTRFKQFICVLLIVVFVVQLIPVYALPVDEEEDNNAYDSEEKIIISDNEYATIVGEIEELRDESVKQFRLSDGSYVAMEFDKPVHYRQADGKWVDIDNTLKPDNFDGKSLYTSASGDIIKHFTGTVDGDKFLFDVEYNNYKIAFSLADTDSADYQDVEDTSEATENTEAVPYDESTPENAVASNETALAWETPIAIVSNPSYTAADSDYTGKRINELCIPDKYTSEILYENVLQNTDFKYICNGYNVKESIIVNEKQGEYVYRFLLNLVDLSPALDEGGNVLLNNSSGDTVFLIPAPYIFDDAGISSDSASYSIKECEGGYLLTINVNPAWMNDDAREYPITIDPEVSLHYNASNLKTAYIREDSPNGTSPSFGDLKCGKYNATGYGACELCVQVENLPEIPNNCVIISAQMHIAHMGLFSSSFGSGVGGSVTVDVRKVNGIITDLNTVTWNTVYGASGMGIQQRILDYRILNESTLGTFVGWDVTPAVLEWYENDSTKGALLFAPENETSIGYFANLTGHAWYDNSPYFIIRYRNTVGVESYNTYRSLSAARAGDIYISDFTSQITLMNNDVSLSTDAVSAEISHVYNTAYTNNLFTSTSESAGIHTCNYSSMDVGKGWKLSVQQTVVPIIISGSQYLLYNDADGTEHYFINTEADTYQDEDGLGLKIKKSTSGGNTIYTMTDADENITRVFHNGYLISITDSNGNAEYIAYNNCYSASNNNWKPTAAGSNRIVQVVMVPKSGALITVATLGYSGNRLATITDRTNRVTSFAYDSNGRVNTITYPDSVIVYYQYDNNGNISKAYDNESHYGLTFTYWSNHHGGYWVNKVTEFTAADVNAVQTTGVAFHGYNTGLLQKQYRYYGEDHLSDTEDDIVEHYVFDYTGKTICVYQTDYQKEKVLGASTASYTGNSGVSMTNNRITGTGALGISNPVLNIDSGFENSGSVTGGDSTASILTASSAADNRVHTGYKSLHFSRGNADIISQGGFNVQLSAGKTYTVSCYVLNYTVSNWSDSSYGKIVIKESSCDTANQYESDAFSSKTTRSIDKGWEKISFSFTPDSTRQYYAAVQASGFTGDYYVDDFQIEESGVATSTNLLINGNPDSGSGWSLSSGASYTTEGTTKFGSGVFKAAGAANKNIHISQDVFIHDTEPGTYILSGWGKAEAVGSSEPTYNGVQPYFGMLAAVVYESSSAEEWHFIPFSSDYTDWQYACGIVVPEKSDPVRLIRVYLFYTNNANTAYFDNISLVREPVQTYSYDDNGNPVSAKDGGAKTSCEYETGTSLLKKYTASTGVVMDFTYESETHNLLTTAYDGIITTNEYHNGLLIEANTVAADWTKQQSSSVYNSYGQKTCSN
ncbi:MAG: RHS repeat protein, partial [Oscillospiraceae bacterium]|nr:RHS repeat protein [Oscillospiraceae bacterium]